MTACVNKKHSRRVAAAVSASLVGALTLGAAPAVVMAEEAPVDQQVADDAVSFQNAEILSIDGLSEGSDGVWFTQANSDGSPVTFDVETIKTGNNVTYNLDSLPEGRQFEVS